MTDTSTEVVERLAKYLDACEMIITAATLRALLEERDILRTEAHADAEAIGALREALARMIAAADCIRHWHDTGRDGEGMIVSAEHVRALWDERDKARAALEPKP